MKRALVLLSLGAIAAAPVRTIPDPVPLTAPTLPDVQRLSLENGTPVWLLARHEVPMVRIELSVTWPGGDTSTEEQLLSALSGVLLDGSGTQVRDSGAWSTALETQGADVSLGMSSRRLWVDVEAPTGSEEAALALAAEALFQPAFDPKTAGPHIERWAASRRDLAMEIYGIHTRGMNHAWFPVGHPLRQVSQAQDIERLDAMDAQALVERVRDTGKAGIVVVGDTSAERVLPQLEAVYGSLGGDAVPVPSVPAEPKATRWLVDRSGFDIAEITVATPAPPFGHPDVPAMQVWMTALAGTFTSRMNQDLREERGLTYGVHGEVSDWYGAGRAEINCVAAHEHVAELVLGMESHLDHMEDQGLTQAELDVARNHLLLTEGRAFQTLRSSAGVLGDLLTLGADLSLLQRDLDRLMTLTPSDISLAARRWTGPAHRVWVVTGPRGPIEIQLEQADRVPDRIVDAEVLSTEP